MCVLSTGFLSLACRRESIDEASIFVNKTDWSVFDWLDLIHDSLAGFDEDALEYRFSAR